MTVKAIGYYSKDVYMTGKSKAEVLRKLQKAFPSPGRGHKTVSPNNLYPEALWLEEE